MEKKGKRNSRELLDASKGRGGEGGGGGLLGRRNATRAAQHRTLRRREKRPACDKRCSSLEAIGLDYQLSMGGMLQYSMLAIARALAVLSTVASLVYGPT